MVIGEPFPDRLRKELKNARAYIIVIGPDWLRAPDLDGRRRIDDPNDWVHQEVRFALECENYRRAAGATPVVS